jgi:hypothetical protein
MRRREFIMALNVTAWDDDRQPPACSDNRVFLKSV